MESSKSIDKQSHKLLIPIGMFYALLLMFVIFFTPKGIHYPYIHFASITLPLVIILFVMGDVITEVYGYRQSQHIIFSSIVLVIFFTLLAILTSKITPYNVPEQWQKGTDQFAFFQVYKETPLFATGYFIAFLISNYFNIRIISRWKVLLKGRYFWIRSIGASGVGALIFSIIDHLIIAYHFTWQEIIYLTLFSFATKIFGFAILSYPASFIVSLLKTIEHIDAYDYKENYNPLKIPSQDIQDL